MTCEGKNLPASKRQQSTRPKSRESASNWQWDGPGKDDVRSALPEDNDRLKIIWKGDLSKT
jgi:hypothetical protein